MDRKIEKKNWTLKKIAMIAGGGIVLLLILYSFLFADGRQKLNVEADRITIAEVKKGSFQEFIPIDGNVQPIKTIFLDVIQGGYVETKYVDGGTNVKAGDPVLKLSNNNLVMEYMQRETQMMELINTLQNTRLSIKQNRFNLRRTLSQLDYQIDAAKDNYERNKKLFEEKVISQQEFNNLKREYERLIQQRSIEVESQRFDSINAINQIEQLEASLQRTYKNMELYKNNMNNLYVKAPISGQLASLNVEIGQSISTGQRIGQIDDLNGFKVRANIDQHYISRIFPGLKGEFDFSGATYNLSITKVYPEVQANGQFQVDMEFDGEFPKGLRRGQTLQIRLQLSDPAEAILLSRGGFFQATGGNWVFVLNEAGDAAEKRNIRVGRQNPKYYEVLEGLQPGDRVVVSSYEGYGQAEKLVLKGSTEDK
jgi:HlyD family secretion protein